VPYALEVAAEKEKLLDEFPEQAMKRLAQSGIGLAGSK
jgi:hypothetical protein